MGLQIDLTELFEPENFLERIQCIGMEQNKFLPVLQIFSWFFWEVELATLGLIAINDIKDGIKIKEMEIIEWMVSIKLIEVMEPMELNV